ncbi:EamA family transporter [Actinomadura hibisca]|uniref:EamA family transporter n=1 Tax=Actinomadura hibisca TaxID=68565 RepID=UPI00082B1F14|nr:EamA family transporter [Actinomadura hibisca]
MLQNAGGGSRTAAFTALAAVAPITWGTTYLVTTEFLPPDRPLLSGVLRTLPAGLAVLLLTRTLPRGRWWWRSAVLGLLNIGAFNVLLFVAAYRLPGGVAATLTSMQPLLVAGMALLLLKERPTAWRLGWGVAGVAGVALMVLRGEAAFDLLGVLAGIAAALSMATGVVLTKRWGATHGAGLLSFTGWQLTAGGLLIVPLALIVEGTPPALDAAAVGGYLWLGVVGTLVAYVLWFQGVGRLPVAAVSFLVLLSPVVATALGWLVLGQPLTALQTAGFVLAMVSILGAQLTPQAASALLRVTPRAHRSSTS